MCVMFFICIYLYLLKIGCRCGCDHIDQLPVQSVSITTKAVSSNSAHGEVCSIQHYVIKFVSDLQQVSGFLAHLDKGNVSFCHHLASLVCRPLTFHILIFSSETQPIEVKLGRKHQWKVLSKNSSFCPDPLTNMASIGNSCF